MKTCFDFQFDCGWIFALKTAKIGGRWKLFFFPFLAKSKKMLIWAGKHLMTTVNFGEQEAIRNAKKPDDYWLSWTSVNMYDNCSIVLLSEGSEVRILSWVPKALKIICFKAFFLRFAGCVRMYYRSFWNEYACTTVHILLTKSERIRGLKERYAYKWQQLFFMIAFCWGIFLPFE